jgi:hypothetical protein
MSLQIEMLEHQRQNRESQVVRPDKVLNDRRHRESATVPLALQILGLVGFAMGMGLTTWAMPVNRSSRGRCACSPTGASE